MVKKILIKNIKRLIGVGNVVFSVVMHLCCRNIFTFVTCNFVLVKKYITGSGRFTTNLVTIPLIAAEVDLSDFYCLFKKIFICTQTAAPEVITCFSKIVECDLESLLLEYTISGIINYFLVQCDFPDRPFYEISLEEFFNYENDPIPATLDDMINAEIYWAEALLESLDITDEIAVLTSSWAFIINVYFFILLMEFTCFICPKTLMYN